MNPFHCRLQGLAVAVAVLAAIGGTPSGQSVQAQEQEYLPALKLIPDTAAGVVRIPNVPELCDAWKTTTLAALVDDPAMQPFIELQRQRSEERAGTLGFNIGVRPRDVLEMASGETVLAWLPFDDPRRPFALALISDIRGRRAQADQVVAQVDTDLRAAGATLREANHGHERVRIYTLKKTPGQITIDEVAITINDQRVIAADRATLVTALLDAVAGTDTRAKIDQAPDYLGVEQQIAASEQPAGEQPAGEQSAAEQPALGRGRVDWFARPLAMGRIIKEAARIDRGRQVDVLNLLQRQGFDAIAAAGGHLWVGNTEFDLLHKGFVWAPPTPGQQERFRLAARVLPVNNVQAQPVPHWVGQSIASFSRLNWKLSDAFWHTESLINDAFGEEIFRDILDGIRDDQDGPRIDIANNVVPNLGEHLMILTDNQMPADLRSERVLVAIETGDAGAIRTAVRKAMEVEPDATVVPSGMPGVDVYRVLRTNEPSDFEAELFEDLGLDRGQDPDAPPPLLNQWAITVIDRPAAGGDGGSGAGGSAAGGRPGYLIFSSHPELLLETVARFNTGNAQNNFGNLPEIQTVDGHIQSLGGDERVFVRMARTDLTLRAKYSLMREGRLRESDSIMASLFRRIFEPENEPHQDLGTNRLPPFEQVEKYFRPSGGFSTATNLGWSLDGFLLK
jgi:hypothetical protein